MALTDKHIKALEPRDKDYKVSDGLGLYLLIKKNGAKYWRMKFRFKVDGKLKEKVLAIGVYPEVSLKKAREETLSARSLLDKGINPIEHRRTEQPVQLTDTSFLRIAEEWFKMKSATWSDKTSDRNRSIMDLWVLPAIGERDMNEMKPLDILKACKTAEDAGHLETAHRMRGMIDNVYRYGIILEYVDFNPAADVKGALTSTKKNHYAAITDPEEVGHLLVAMDEYKGTFVVKTATWCSAYWFCRPGEVRYLEWDEVNLKDNMVVVPASKMKQLKNALVQDHMIPLCTQSAQLLKDLYPITGRSKYVFPSARGGSRPLSENTVRVALRTMGYDKTQMTAHGFRAMARTLLDEELEYRVDWIEHQLAHEVKDANGRAYNRTKFLAQRKTMMQDWADYLDELKFKTNNGLPIIRKHESV